MSRQCCTFVVGKALRRVCTRGPTCWTWYHASSTSGREKCYFTKQQKYFTIINYLTKNYFNGKIFFGTSRCLLVFASQKCKYPAFYSFLTELRLVSEVSCTSYTLTWTVTARYHPAHRHSETRNIAILFSQPLSIIVLPGWWHDSSVATCLTMLRSWHHPRNIVRGRYNNIPRLGNGSPVVDMLIELLND